MYLPAHTPCFLLAPFGLWSTISPLSSTGFSLRSQTFPPKFPSNFVFSLSYLSSFNSLPDYALHYLPNSLPLFICSCMQVWARAHTNVHLCLVIVVRLFLFFSFRHKLLRNRNLWLGRPIFAENFLPRPANCIPLHMHLRTQSRNRGCRMCRMWRRRILQKDLMKVMYRESGWGRGRGDWRVVHSDRPQDCCLGSWLICANGLIWPGLFCSDNLEIESRHSLSPACFAHTSHFSVNP
jgi:hypothetical protein